MPNRVFVIAEAGSCHDGSLEKALRLIRTAKVADADAVKFQFWSSAERLAERRHAGDYLEVYRRYQLPPDWLKPLRQHCDEVGIEFMCTTYLPEDVATIAPFVERFKIASFEAADLEFVRRHQKYPKPIYVSSGMLGLTELQGLVKWCGLALTRDVILHCVSAYPCPSQDLHLRTIAETAYGTHGVMFGGLSDHTHSLLAGAVAVGAGAEVIEKHFQLDDTDPKNPDAAVALGRRALRQYIANIREAEVLMGDPLTRPLTIEEPMRRYQVRA
jgi:sialic acid synthase SpsE